MYLVSIATLTNYHIFSSLEQYPFLFSLFCREEILAKLSLFHSPGLTRLKSRPRPTYTLLWSLEDNLLANLFRLFWRKVEAWWEQNTKSQVD
jgi:hypothetical protein